MENNATLWFFKQLKSESQCLLYNGIFSDTITDKIFKLYKSNLENSREILKIKKRVLFLLAECFQNIIRHGTKSMDDHFYTLDQGFFLVRHYAGSYYLVSGNSINNKNVEKLKSQLELVNKLDKDQLDILYKQIISEGKLSAKGGAGLGLIEMARKSGQNLIYRFEKFNNDFSLFYNQIVLKSEVETSIAEENTGIDFAIDLHKKMVDETILMLQKGDFSRGSIFPVLKIIENNIVNDKHGSYIMREIYNILFELLLNISKHCYSDNEFKIGIFSLSKRAGKYKINAGNYIEKNKIAALKEHLDNLNRLNKDELKDLYVHELKYGKETKKGGLGIGLIEIARLQSEKIKYSFDDSENNVSFFTINVVI